MTIFNKYSKTKQFRDVVKEVQQYCKHHNLALPVLTFEGTVKLHGTNAGIGYRIDTDFLWAQSRERVITPEDDNAGFAKYVEANKEFFKNLMADICIVYNTYECMIFGEWAGKGVHSGVAISQLEKDFYVFGVKAYTSYYIDGNGEIVKEWCNVRLKDENFPFKRITDYDRFTVDIDFSNPSAIQNKLAELTLKVEEECPVASKHGIKGIGEGIVWTYNGEYGNYLFKTKGEKHSVSKVKTVAVLSEEDLARIANAKDAVDTFATQARLEQGIAKLGEMGLDIEMKNLGAYLKWVSQDILAEDGDIIEAAMLDRKLLMGEVTNKAKAFFMEYMKNA